MNAAEYAALAESERIKGIIVKRAARLAWVQWWAGQCSCGRADYETHRLDGTRDADPDKHRELGAVPGAELMDIAPQTPHDALTWAESLIYAVEHANGGKQAHIAELYRAAAEVPLTASWHIDADPEDFGHAIAAEALGMGIGWADNHPRHNLTIPHREYMGRSIHPVPVPGFCRGSSRRRPINAAELSISDETGSLYNYVGGHDMMGLTWDVWRRSQRERRMVLPLLDARIPAPMYIFQPRRD